MYDKIDELPEDALDESEVQFDGDFEEGSPTVAWGVALLYRRRS